MMILKALFCIDSRVFCPLVRPVDHTGHPYSHTDRTSAKKILIRSFCNRPDRFSSLN